MNRQLLIVTDFLIRKGPFSWHFLQTGRRLSLDHSVAFRMFLGWKISEG
jgi:hypothetical protein